jgi:DNA invertase Pin-like site-specific DNA recombinase
MKTAIYCRISTDKQSHDSQLLELRTYCQRRGWADVHEFSDVMTGSKFTRRGLDALFADVRKGKVARIVVYKLDRLGRSLAHLVQLVAELTANGTALICTSQGIDTSDTNPAGRLQLGVLMAVAEFEREIIRERVNSGLAAARARGARLGRPNRLDEHRAAVAALLAQGKGVREIARELGLPVSSAYKLVRATRNGRREPGCTL